MNDEKKGVTLVAGTGSSSINTLAMLTAAQGNPQPERKIIPIRSKPNLEGEFGKAWKCNLKEGRRIEGIKVDQDAGLIHWVIEAPWAHPVWAFYSILLMHLRPLVGMSPPVIHLSGATHEMLVFACNQERDLTDMVKTGIVKGNWLSPPNFGSQMIYKSDEEALAKVEATVKEILVGTLSPDTDFRSQWVQRFGNVMIKEDFR